MTSTPSLFDVCERKHGGNVQSVAANRRIAPHKVSMAERVRVFIVGCDFHGATLHEICKCFGKLPHQISGRITELKKDGKIFESARSRNGASVLVSRREWVNGSAQ